MQQDISNLNNFDLRLKAHTSTKAGAKPFLQELVTRGALITEDQYSKLADAVNKSIVINDKLKKALDSRRANSTINKRSGDTYGDMFNAKPLTQQLRAVWEQATVARHVVGENSETGEKFDYWTKPWASIELRRLAMIGKATAKLEEWDEWSDYLSDEDALGVALEVGSLEDINF